MRGENLNLTNIMFFGEAIIGGGGSSGDGDTNVNPIITNGQATYISNAIADTHVYDLTEVLGMSCVRVGDFVQPYKVADNTAFANLMYNGTLITAIANNGTGDACESEYTIGTADGYFAVFGIGEDLIDDEGKVVLPSGVYVNSLFALSGMWMLVVNTA